MKRLTCLILLFFEVSLLAGGQCVFAAPYYQGKRISIIVGYSPGGMNDRMARIFAKYLPKYIPGNPTVIVQNMPGAGSILAGNYIYNIAKPDGLTISTFDRGLLLAQLLKVEGVKFDLRKVGWVGSMAVEAIVMVLRSDLPFKNFNDVLQSPTPLNMGCAGASDSTAQMVFLLQGFTGLKRMNMISYYGTAEIMLAIERKELDGRGAAYSTVKLDIDRGLLRPFVRSRVVMPGIENLPVDEDLVKDPKGKTFMALRASQEQVGRPYVCPPGTPDNVMKILREAFAEVVNDPKLKEDAKRINQRFEYLSAKECLNVINFVMNQPDAMVKEFEKYIKY